MSFVIKIAEGFAFGVGLILAVAFMRALFGMGLGIGL